MNVAPSSRFGSSRFGPRARNSPPLDQLGRDRLGRPDRSVEAGVEPARGSSRRLRLLLGTAVASVLLSYVLMVLAAGVAGLTADPDAAGRGVLIAAIPVWLAAHQVPLVVSGAPLGVLPLLPTFGVVALVALLARRVTRALGGRLREDASAVVAALAGTHASAAVLATALPQSPVQATPWAALLGGGLVAAVGAGIGVFHQAGLPAWWGQTPTWLRTGLAAAGIGALGLTTGGALLLFSALLVAMGELHNRLEMASPTLGAAVGITVLSLCYLPNALVASVSWLAGPGVSIGPAAASPLFSATAALPPFPLMAAMPVASPPSWGAVVFVLPMLAGALSGVRCRRVSHDHRLRLYAVGFAAATAAIGFGLLAALVSGRLAGGPFDPVELPAPALAAAVLGWIGVPATAVALLPDRARATRRPNRRVSAHANRRGAGMSPHTVVSRTRTVAEVAREVPVVSAELPDGHAGDEANGERPRRRGSSTALAKPDDQDGAGEAESRGGASEPRPGGVSWPE